MSKRETKEAPKPEKRDRSFLILLSSVEAEENTCPHTIEREKTVEKFVGKTPMQAARVAFAFLAARAEFEKKCVYIFTIEESILIADGSADSPDYESGKLYSYRGTREPNAESISIKACKRTTKSTGIEIKKNKKLKRASMSAEIVISDGFIVEKKIIPPREVYLKPIVNQPKSKRRKVIKK